MKDPKLPRPSLPPQTATLHHAELQKARRGGQSKSNVAFTSPEDALNRKLELAGLDRADYGPMFVTPCGDTTYYALHLTDTKGLPDELAESMKARAEVPAKAIVSPPTPDPGPAAATEPGPGPVAAAPKDRSRRGALGVAAKLRDRLSGK